MSEEIIEDEEDVLWLLDFETTAFRAVRRPHGIDVQSRDPDGTFRLLQRRVGADPCALLKEVAGSAMVRLILAERAAPKPRRVHHIFDIDG